MDRSTQSTSAGSTLLHLDLNMLIALDALLHERSVTRAAERLQRSQPALSASLKRLRHQFQDDLLVRVGNRHELTPLAVQLKGRLGVLLADVERLFEARSRFDASRSTRDFVVGASDYGQHMLGRALAAELAEAAPNVRLRFRHMTDDALESPEDSIRNVDGYIFPLGLIEGLPHVETYIDRWVLIVDADNSRVGEAVTLDELSSLDWVSAFHRQGSMVPAVRQLQLLGVDVNVVVATEAFAPIPSLLRGSDRIAVIQEGLARQVAHPDQFRIIECPFEAVPLVECFWWHPSLSHDPGHVWFRSVVERAGRRMAQELANDQTVVSDPS
jgi:DNA-binding transcriptional LysR family regulator